MISLKTPVNALSQSPDGDQVVCAGREVLKILNIPPARLHHSAEGEWDPSRQRITEAVNLRAGSRLNLNLSCNDVKWCNSYAKHLIATAATNGAIVIWDLNKAAGQKQGMCDWQLACLWAKGHLYQYNIA